MEAHAGPSESASLTAAKPMKFPSPEASRPPDKAAKP